LELSEIGESQPAIGFPGLRFAPAGLQDHCFRGQAAATATASQLTIKSVPPVGAAIGNRPCPAYCRKVSSPANNDAAMTNPNAAAIPIRALTTSRSTSATTASTAVA